MFASRSAQSNPEQVRASHPRQARLVVAAALLALLGLGAALVDPRGVRQLRLLTGELQRQRQANAKLQAEKAALEAAVRSLRFDKGPAAERAVREGLGFVRDDEVVFKFE